MDTIYIAAGVTFAGVGRDSVTINWGDTEHRFALMVSLAGANEVYGIEFRNPLGSSRNSGITALHAFTAQPIVLHDCRVTEAKTYLDGDTRFEVYANHFDYGQGRGLFVGGLDCRVHDNLFTVSGANGAGKGIWAWLAGKVVVENNRFLADPDPYSNPFAIEIEECDTAFVRNNLIHRCQAAVIWSESNGAIENNTMISSDPDWFASLEVFQGQHDQVTIRNNVFVDMERPIVLGPQSGVDTAGLTTLVHNIFWPPRDTLYSRGVQWWRVPLVESLNVIAYPMFADDSIHRLQAGSPLIDAGDPTVLDADGSRSDIGWTGGPGGVVYEYPQLPPRSPDSLWATGADTMVHLTWLARPEADLAGYRLFRGTASGFWHPGLVPNLELSSSDTTTTDTLPSAPDRVFYVLTAFDIAGLESGPSPEVEYVIGEHPNHAPVLDPIGPQSVREGDTLTLSITASDPDGDSLTLKAENLPTHSAFTDSVNGSGVFAFQPDFSQAGVHVVRFIASDGRLADSETVRIAVGSVNRAPSLLPITARTVTEGQTLTVRVSASDPDGDSLFLSAENLPINSAFTDSTNGAGAFTFHPDLSQAGDYNVRIIASDRQLGDSEVVTITVRDLVLPESDRPCILRVYPNPSNSSSVIEVAVPPVGSFPAPLAVWIYDVLGRRVRTIETAAPGPGVYPLAWDGSNGNGETLASGVYFARLRVWSRSFGRPQSMLLIK